MRRLQLISISIILLFMAATVGAEFNDWGDLVDVNGYNQQFSMMFKTSSKCLIEAKYDELEAIFDKYRKNKELCIGGTWVLSELYDSLSFHFRDPSEKQFLTRIRRLNDWISARPECITPRVALADCMIGYAFYGRGDGYAYTVSEDRWKIFYARLHAAENILLQAKSLKQKCPGWWAAYLRIASAGWNDRPRYEQLFNEAIAFEPKYNIFYYYRAWDLMPRWHGREGELERFAKSAAGRFKGDEADMIYAGIILFLDTRGPCENRKNKNPDISWERAIKGVNLLNARAIKWTPPSIPGRQPAGS